MALNWMAYGFTKATGGPQHFTWVVNLAPGLMYRALCGQMVSGTDKARKPDWERMCPGCYREARRRAGNPVEEKPQSAGAPGEGIA